MTRIAEIAGYGIGTVYEYFPNRRSLLCELMHQTCENEFQAVMALAPGFARMSVQELVAEVLRLLVASAADNRVLMRVVALEVLPTLDPGETEDLVPMFAGVLAQHLRMHVEQTRVADPDMAARFILTGVEAIVADAVLERPQWLEQPEFLEELVAFVTGYLAAERASTAHATARRSLG